MIGHLLDNLSQNWSSYVGLAYAVISALGIVLTALIKVFPDSVWLANLAQFVGSISLDFAKLESRHLQHAKERQAMKEPKSDIPPVVSDKGFITFEALPWMTVLVLCAALACGMFAAVAPSAVPLAACVTSDALGGKTLAQIVADCGGDVEAIVEVLLSSQDPAIEQTIAGKSAIKLYKDFTASEALDE
jgi:hypothetical protein